MAQIATTLIIVGMSLFLAYAFGDNEKTPPWTVHFPSVKLATRAYGICIEDCWKEVAAERGYVEVDSFAKARMVISKVAVRAHSCDNTRQAKLYNHVCNERMLSNKRLMHALVNDTDIKVPLTYDLSTHKGVSAFRKAMREDSQSMWVLKESTTDNGKGVVMVNCKQARQALEMRKRNTVQFDLACTLIHPPLLVGDRKCDFRVFVLVASVAPLVVYMYKDFMTRLSAYNYDTDNMDSMFSVNPDANDSDEAWTKCQLSPERLDSALGVGFAENVVRAQLHPMLNTLFQTAARTSAILPTAGGYSLFGIDAMLDANNMLWLIEVNSSPQMSKGNASQWKRDLNMRISHDTFTILEELWEQVSVRGHVHNVAHLDQVAATTGYEKIRA